MRKSILIIFIILGISLYFLLNRNTKPLIQEVDQLEIYQKQRKDSGKILDKKMQVYGKVIDGESNQPLQGVLLEISYQHYSPMPPLFFSTSLIKVVSDEKGLFSIDNVYGRGLFLRKITKDNYWEREKKNDFPNNSFSTYVPDKENPIIFKLYKEVKDNYLLSWDSVRTRCAREGEVKVFYYGILKRFNTDYEQEIYDFQCKTEKINAKTIVSLKGFDETYSFFLSDKDFLNENELSNFKNELTIEEEKDLSTDKSEEKLHYLYIRFSKMQLYARSKLVIELNERSSCLKFSFKINPYGEFNFETFDLNKISSEIRIAIRDEYGELLEKGILPKRSDLKKYFKDLVPIKPQNLHKEDKKIDIKSIAKNSKMSFYGKVLDGKGKAIPEAIVAFSFYFYDDKDEIRQGRKKIKADKNGLFVIDDVWGYRLSIVDIFKFEYFRNRVIRGNFDDRYFVSNFSASHAPNKNSPEVFQLTNELSGNFNDINQSFVPTIIKTGEEKEFLYKFLNEFETRNADNFDLKVNIQLLKSKCIVNISSREENSGFIISDAENISSSDQKIIREGLFELPISDDGKSYKRIEKYLLLKFLNERFYAKLHLDFLIGNSECQFYAESKINLFGTKEFDDFKKIKYTGSIYKHLRDRNELKATNGEMEGVLDKKDFIKDYNNQFLKAQFKVPPGTDPRLESHIDEMKEFLQYRIFEEDE